MDIEDLFPCVPLYGPMNIKDLKVGSIKLWCSCGLSKNQPWCDNSHINTNFKPLKWVVPGTLKDGGNQVLYSICACKYTSNPPYCDATHTNLPCEVIKRQKECKENHTEIVKICHKCGFKASMG